jgi:hypothetical protein
VLDPQCGHFGEQFKVGNLSVVQVVETSRDESVGLTKKEDRHINDAAALTMRPVRQLPDPEWLRN